MLAQQDVMATHGVSGFVGTLLTGIFAYKPVNMDEPKLTGNGLLFGGGVAMFCEEAFTATMVSLYGNVFQLRHTISFTVNTVSTSTSMPTTVAPCSCTAAKEQTAGDSHAPTP